MDNASKSELSIPDWLNNTFFETALKSGEKNDSIKIISSEIKPATLPGDNYASNIFRVSVQIQKGAQKEERSLIIKIIASGMTETIEEVFEVSSGFRWEADTFRLAHTALYEVLDKISMGSNQPFAAKLIYFQDDYPKSAIVLEDLKKRGFRLAQAESTLGLDLNHCRLVMRTIARYHAASVAVVQQNPKFMEFFLEKVDERKTEASAFFFAGNVRNLAKEVSTWPDYKERYGDKLHKLVDITMKEWVRGTRFDENSFNVLNHGDLWANNMMFRYSDATGEVEEVRFVDFQLTRWTTPVADLLYFLNSSASPEVLENVDALIEEYHSTFSSILTQLGYKHLVPSLKQLNEEIEKRRLFGVLAAITIRVVYLTDPTKVPDLIKVAANEEKIHLADPYKTCMKKLLPLYEKRGWL